MNVKGGMSMNELEIIEDIQQAFEYGKKIRVRYETNKEGIKKAQEETQDLLHLIELNDYDKKEKLYLYEELRKCRQRRREMKKENERLYGIYKALEEVKFLNNKEHNRFKGKLGEEKGNIKEIIRTQEERDYYPRVRTDLSEGVNPEETILDKLKNKFNSGEN